MLQPVYGHAAGLLLYVLSLGIASFRAAVEVSMGFAYVTAQVFGWNWSATSPARKQARFSATYSVAILAGIALVLTGLNPLKLTMFTMAASCLTLPAIAFPFLA